jgi:hypothetical protein
MRKALLSISLSLALLTALGQTKPVSKQEPLVVQGTSFDFGRIPQGKPVTHVFKVSNAGTAPLVIENVQASCGCTTPQWSTEPIPAGRSAEIKVGYNSESEGPFEKTITVSYNEGQMKTLTIKGFVWKAPAQPAPANTSLTLLKNVN